MSSATASSSTRRPGGSSGCRTERSTGRTASSSSGISTRSSRRLDVGPPSHGLGPASAGCEGFLVSPMSFGNWEMQAGDPAVFAFRLAFLPNPYGDADRATSEERESWGAFSVWAHGENLCAHIEQGEILDSAHWYLLPLIEWLVD